MHYFFTFSELNINSFFFQNYQEPKKRKKSDAADELISLAAKRLQQPPDEYDQVAGSWACKLRKMNPTQRIYAEKCITDILLEGQMGTLHRNCMQLNILCQNPSSEYSLTPTQNTFSPQPTQVALPIVTPEPTQVPLPFI